MEKETLELPAFDWEDWDAGDGKFSVEVANPNGGEDENTLNDAYFTNYELPDIYPGTIVVHFKTNKAAYQNRYEFMTNTGMPIWEKEDFEDETLYIDTISFLNGCYDFYLWDSGDNGIDFWAEPEEGKGYIRFYDLNGDLIKHFEPDFGNRIYNSFYADMYLGISESHNKNLGFDILPNPNSGHFVVSYALQKVATLSLSVYNSSGQQVWIQEEAGKQQGKINIALDKLPAGIYSCKLKSGENMLSKKFIISK
jgi:hypothetical protein